MNPSEVEIAHRGFYYFTVLITIQARLLFSMVGENSQIWPLGTNVGNSE